MVDPLILRTHQQPQNPTSIEKLLDLEKKVATLERRVSLIELDRDKQATALRSFTNHVKTIINGLEKELTNHIMNTAERR